MDIFSKEEKGGEKANTAGMPLVASLVWDLLFEREKMPNKASKCLLFYLVHFAFTYEFHFWELHVSFFEPTPSSFMAGLSPMWDGGQGC